MSTGRRLTANFLYKFVPAARPQPKYLKLLFKNHSMKYKFVMDRSNPPSVVMSIEVWELGHVAQPIKRFPFSPTWWAKDEGRSGNLNRYEPMSQAREEALEKAGEFYDSLPHEPAPKTRFLVDRIDY